MALVLALSLSGTLTKVSVIVSIAALVGVALLALLFFAQARELKRLREWAARAPERAEELTRALAASARPVQTAPRPSPAAQRVAAAAAATATRAAAATSATLATALPVPPTAAGTAVAGLAVAGERLAPENGAAALAARTAPAAPPAPATPPAPLRPAAPGAAGRPAAPAPATTAPPPLATPPLAAPVPIAMATPAPATAAAAPAASAAARVPAAQSARSPLPPAPARAAAQPPGATRSGTAGAGRPGAGRAATIYRRERTPARKIALVLGGLVVAAAVAVLLVSLLSAKGKSSATGETHRSSTRSAAIAPSRGSLHIAVLNATETDGLAAGVAHSLKGKGYAKATALYGTPTGSYPVTVVEYRSGQRVAAGEVAKLLHVPSQDVKPMPSSTAPLAAGAHLVVIVGESAATEGSGEASSEGEAVEGEVAEGEVAEGEADLGETAAEPGA